MIALFYSLIVCSVKKLMPWYHNTSAAIIITCSPFFFSGINLRLHYSRSGGAELFPITVAAAVAARNYFPIPVTAAVAVRKDRK